VKHQNDLEDMHYFNEGNVDVNMVGYDIINVSIGYCIFQLDDVKYNLDMWVLHKPKIIQYNSLPLKYATWTCAVCAYLDGRCVL